MRRNVSLIPYSNYRIGGPADYFVPVKSLDILDKALERSMKLKLPVVILAGGTNILIDDAGVRGIVVKPEFRSLRADGNSIRVGAGASMAELLEYAARRGLSGLEWAGGLPGTVGGAIRGNAGAFGGEIKDTVAEVTAVSLRSPRARPVRRFARACRFGYRTSIFKENGGEEMIVEAVFKLRRGDPRALREAIEEKIKYRQARHPLEYPNIGSIFKNVDLRLVGPGRRGRFASVVKIDPFPVVPAAYLIDKAGLKGVSCGGAMISPKHANFIVNTLQASAGDVRALIRLAQKTVRRIFAVSLEEEIMYLGGNDFQH